MKIVDPNLVPLPINSVGICDLCHANLHLVAYDRACGFKVCSVCRNDLNWAYNLCATAIATLKIPMCHPQAAQFGDEGN